MRPCGRYYSIPDGRELQRTNRRVSNRSVGSETTMWYPPLLLFNMRHREERGLLRIRPGLLRLAFRHFSKAHIRADSTRFFAHHRAIECALDFLERYVSRRPLRKLGARYIIDAVVSSQPLLVTAAAKADALGERRPRSRSLRLLTGYSSH